MGVPSSLTGLLIFVVLLLPGFVYTSLRGRRRPERPANPLRDVIEVVGVSLAALLAVALVFGLLRVLLPGHTPQLRPLVVAPRAYVNQHYLSLAWWLVGLLALAVAGAAALALARWSPDSLARLPGLRFLAAREGDSPWQSSGWGIVFSQYPECQNVVGCTLSDGSYVRGQLYSFSQSAVDGPDRDLVLMAPLEMRAAGDANLVELTGAGMMTLSARNIVTMTVSYVPIAPPAP